MAYRFKLNESADKALLRTGSEQLQRALASLRNSNAREGIHGTRKCIKRLRALLRLARAGLDKAAYQNLNTTLRDAGRTLSATRDRDVLLATTAELSAAEPHLRAALQRTSANIVPPSGVANLKQDAAVIRKARDLLQTAQTDWQALELSDDTFATFAYGLERGLRDIGQAYAETEGGDEEAFHDLRKTVQRHWRHMRLVEAGWPAYFRARAEEAKEISDLLGKAQDLTLLLRHLRIEFPESISGEALTELIRTVEQRRTTFQDIARSHTSRLIAESPRAHARRAAEYWTAAQMLRQEQLPHPAETPPVKAPAEIRPIAIHPAPRKRSARTKPAAGKRAVKASRTTRKPA